MQTSKSLWKNRIQLGDHRLQHPILNMIKYCDYGSELWRGIYLNIGLNRKSKCSNIWSFTV